MKTQAIVGRNLPQDKMNVDMLEKNNRLKNGFRLIFLCLLTLFTMFSSTLNAATITSTATGGAWATGTTWVGGIVPALGDAVIIATTGASNVSITVSITQTATGSVTINNGAILNMTVTGVTLSLGALTISSGGVFNVNRNLTVQGATSITGTINFASTSTAARTMTFTGDITLNTGAVWIEPSTGNGANNAYRFAGNFTNNATTFTAIGTGTHTFSGTTKTFNGSTISTISRVTITGTRTISSPLTVVTLLTITTVTVTNNSIITATTALSGTGNLTQGATGILNIGGTSGITTLNATTAGNNVNYSGAAETIKSTNYYHLTLGGSGIKTLQTATTTIGGNLTLSGTASTTTVANLSVAGNFVIGSGTTFTQGSAFTFGVSGTTGITGTYTDGSTGTKTLTGDITLNAGAVWNETSISAYTIAGNFTNNATTFIPNTGVHTFSGTSKTLSGTTITSIPNAAFTGSYTNANTLTITTALTGAGTLTQGTNSVLNIAGTSAVTTMAATANLNTANYTGAAQTINSGNYYHLNLTGSGAKTFQSGTTSIVGNLTLTGTVSATSAANMTIGGNLDIGTGTTLSPASTYTFGVTGTTNITGTYTDGSTGTKTFTGDITLNAGSVWNETAISAYNIAGNITNNATTFTTNTGVHTFSGSSKSVSGSTITSIPSITISGSYTNNNTLAIGTALAGAGSLTQATSSTLNLGGTSSISSLIASNSGNTVNYTGASQTVYNSNYTHLVLSGSGSKTMQTGTTTISGNFSITATASVIAVIGLSIAGNVNIGLGTTFSGGSYIHNIVGDWTTTGTFTGGTSTINLAGGSQTITGNITFNNLTFGGSAGKTIAAGTAVTINGILSIENGANANTFSGTLAYGSAATLKYNTSTARTASTEWISPFTGTGGIIIVNTGEITLNENKVFNSSIPLTINANASFNTDVANNYSISLGGNFSNSGNFSANASPIIISGTMTTQSLSGFVTTGTVSMTKTAGTATLQSNVNATILTINGTGGILHFGTGLTHTFSGDITLNSGILNGGSSTLIVNSTSATAWTGTGSNFTAGTGSVSFGGGNQTINTSTAFNNIVLGGTGTKTFTAATTTSGNFSINKNVLVNLGTALTHSSQYLYFAGVNQTGGAGISWGGTASAATYKNASYFGSTDTGKLNVSATSACGTNTWSGASSTDWNNASNWCGGIPTAITAVFIPAAATRQPTISSAAVCDGISIETGATLTISSTNNLTVYGDWANNGTFTANSSTVLFSDPVAQAISGTSTTTFNNLSLAQGAVISFTKVPTVNGILSMEGSSVSTGATFGSAATLQYNTSSTFTTGAEWVTPFIATGGVIIKNTGQITLGGTKQLGNSTNVALNINANAKLATANFGLIFNGNFINAGTFAAGSSAITIDGTVSAQNIAGFTTSGAVTINKSAGTATLTGNLNAAALTSSTSGGTLHLGTALTHTISGDWTRTNGTVNGGSSTLNIGGNVTNTAGSFTIGTSTVNYTGGAQNTASINYYNLLLSGSGTKSMQSGTTSIGNNFTLSGTASATTAANLSVIGNLTIGSGTTLATSSTFTLGVTGTTNITGTYTDGSTGAKTFSADIALNAGSVWNETAISAYSIAGNFTNNANTFTGNTGVHTFSGATKILSGSTTFSIPNSTFSGTYTNNGTLTVSTALSGAGSLTQGTVSTLNIGGTSGITTLNATTNINTVNYFGAAQTVHANNYSSITLSGSGTKTLQSGTTSIIANFSLSGTITATAVTAMTIGGNVNIGSGTTFTGGSFTHNIAGNWTKTGSFTATGSTINFNGTSAQSIGASNFNNVTLSGSGTISATGNLSIIGNLSISSNFFAGSYNHTLQGNWTNNGSFTAGTSTISLSGSSPQTLGGAYSTSFYNLTQNGTGLVTLGISSTVTGILGMSLGNIELAGYNLTVGATSGGSANSYVQTNGVGRLIQYVDYNISKSYPVGKSAYNPVSVRNNSFGGGDYFHVGVSDDPISNANDVTKTVNRRWYIFKNNAGTANVTLGFTYNSGEGQTNFNAGSNPKLGLFSGSFWRYTTATVNGTTFSATGDILDINTPNQFIGMGSENAFDASKFGLTIDPATPVRNSNSTVLTVQSLNSNNIPTDVMSDVTFSLSATNTSLFGTPTGTISTGSHQTTVNSVIFTATTLDTNADSIIYRTNALVTATQNAGISGTSDSIAVIDAAIYEPVATENWVATDGWRKSINGGSTWTNPATLPGNNDFSETDVIRIPSGITLTADTTATFFSMLIYGTLNIVNGGHITINHNVLNGIDNDYNLHVEGVLENSGGVLINTDIAYPIDIHGGNYIHAMNGGNIPVATWVSNGGVTSTCQITGITATPLTGLNQTFENFSWNNASQSVIQYLDGDMAVSDTLRLTNGVITTTASHIIEAASGSLIRTNGYVNGNFRLYVPNTTAPTVIFPIGDATHYAPISITFAGTVSGSGYLDTYTTAAQPPFASGLSQTKYINRKWNIENNGVAGFTSYNATLTCNDNDKVGSPILANLVVRKLNGSTWFTTPTTRPNSNAVTCTGLTGFSDFYIGESDCSSINAIWMGSTNTDWNTASNWCNNAVPSSTSNITIPNGITNYPLIGSAGASCNNINIMTGSSLAISGAYTMDVKGNWTNDGTFTANTGTVSFTGTSTQTILSASTFNNLTINNNTGVSAAANLTVNGILTLTSSNPDATHGTLDLGTYTLNMPSSTATVSGNGDVSGTSKRTHTFSTNVQYSFGSQFTSLTFLGAGTQPDELTCKITLGTALPVGGSASTFVFRNYSFSQTGVTGTDRVAVNLHYLPSELNGQDETKIVMWDHHPSDGRTEEHGKTNSSTLNKWIGLSGLTIGYVAPDPTSSSYNKQLGLSNYTTTKKTWTGASNTNWSNSDNWSPAGAPVSTDDVLIPKILTVYPTLTADAEIRTLQIDSLATLSASTYNLAITGYTGAWINKGTFAPGTGTVSFMHGVNNQIVSVSGNTQFNNLYFGANTYVRPGSGSLIQVSGLANGEVSSIVDLSAIGNTVEFNGTDQYISNPSTDGFGFSGYYNLKISGSGTKTLVMSDQLDIAGNLINNDTLDVSSATVNFAGTSPQIISGTTASVFNNVTVNNPTGVTSTTDLTVNGILQLTDNPSVTKGALGMGSNTLTMGSLATDTGTGDVIGSISRNGMVASKLYTFGNPYSNAIFAANIGTIPTNATMNVALGTSPSWKTSAVKRIYTLTQTGNVSTKATLQMHYLDNELNGNTEVLLVPWYYVSPTVYEGVSRSNFDVTNNSITLSNVNFSFPTGTQFTLANSTVTSSIWTGATSTDWNTSSNWYNAVIPTSTSNVIIPDASTVPNNPTLATDTISTINIQSGGILNSTSNAILTLNGSNGTWNNDGTFNPNTSIVIFANGTEATVSGTTDFYNITISSGTRLSNQTAAVIGIAGAVTNNGVWSTTSQGISTVNYNGGAQSVVIPDASSRRYNNLILSGSGNKTMPTTPSTLLNIVGDFTMSGTASTTLMGILNFDGNVTLESGTSFTTGSFTHTIKGDWTNNGATVDNSTSTFDFDGTTTQTIGGTTSTSFNNLTISNSSSIYVANNLTLSGNLSIPNSSTSLYLAGNLVNNGTIDLSAGTVLFNGTTPQTVGGSSSSTFKNLTVSNLAGLTASNDEYINGILSLTVNPDATHGVLDMGINTLNMGVSATNIGIGDVTGIVKRQHTFVGDTSYTFGNEHTSIRFINASGSTKPDWIILKIAIGVTPSWNSSAVKRIYSFAQSGGTDRTITHLHYLDSELNGNTDETKLVYWDAYSSPTYGSKYPRSKSEYNIDNNWIGLTGMAINFMAPYSTLDTKQWTLGYSNVEKITWTGNGSPTYYGDWNLPGNWNGGVPTANDDVVIPAPADLPVDTHGLPIRNLLSSPAVCNSLEIKSGATLTVDNFNITIYGSTGAWMNNGTFIPGSGTVIFANGSTSNTVTIGGASNFNNLTVGDNTQIQPLTANVLNIAGTLTAGSGSIIDFTTNTNTVEYNGTSAQNVILPQSGYSNLVLSGNSTKTLPSTALSVLGDLTINGSSTEVNASNALSAGGVLTVSAGTTMDMKTYPLSNLTSNSGTGTLKTQNTGSNPIPSGKTWTESVVYNGSAPQTLPAGTFANLQISNTAATTTATGTLNSTNLTIDNGAILDMGANLLSSMTTNSGTGTLKTQNTSSTPMPTGITWTGNVVYNGSVGQSVVGGTYSGLQISNTVANATSTGTLNTTNLTIDNGAVLDMNTNLLSTMTTNTGTGTLKTQNTSSLPIPSAKTWSGTVIYNGSEVQTAVAGTFNNLTCDNGAELDLNDSITVSGTVLINSSKEMDINAGAKMVANQITNNAGSTGLYVLANSSGANGTLIFNNSAESSVSATVAMYSKAAASVVNGSSYSQYKWQYFGIPVQSIATNPTFAAYVGSINNGSYINKHVESGVSSSTYWVSQGNSAVLIPFAGYELTQKMAKTIYFEGQLLNNDFTQVLSYTSGATYPGQHILSNPYTAAIDISKLTFGSETEGTVYLYNTGSHDDWATQTGVDGTAGQYVSAPKSTAGIGGVPGQIPSMQGFLVVAKSSSQNATIEIPYSSVIRNSVKQRTRSISNISTDKVYTRIDIAGTRYSDKMWIFTDATCTRGFDNGWDGQKFLGSSLTPQLWAMETSGDYQVDAVDNINNTNLGFITGEDTNYTMTFTHENLGLQYSALYLIDLVDNNKVTDITISGSSYSFTAIKSSTPVNRFKIVTSPGIATGISNSSTKSLNIFSNQEGMVFVQNSTDLSGNLEIFDIAGRVLSIAKFSANGLTVIPTDLVPGSYVVNAATTNLRVKKQIVFR